VLLLTIIYTINLSVVRPRSCRVIYYFDTPALGRRHQSFGRVNVRAASDVVAGMLQMNDYQMHVLFDSGATHSFIANKNVTKLSKETKRVEKEFIIGTPLGET